MHGWAVKRVRKYLSYGPEEQHPLLPHRGGIQRCSRRRERSERHSRCHRLAAGRRCVSVAMATGPSRTTNASATATATATTTVATPARPLRQRRHHRRGAGQHSSTKRVRGCADSGVQSNCRTPGNEPRYHYHLGNPSEEIREGI